MSISADLKTQAYFDQNTPEWSDVRYFPMIEWLRDNSNESQSLVDIGCGTGNVLSSIKRSTPITQFSGIDITQNYLDQTERNVGCRTYLGSTLDTKFCNSIAGKFDYALMGAVLHHLVGATRTASINNALTAVTNAIKILKPGGHLLIYEPAHYPRFMMWWVFWIKKCFSLVASNRIEMGKKWINLGLPVVSYFTNEQIVDLIEEIKGVGLIDAQYNEPKKLGLGISRTSSTFIIRKDCH